MSTESDHILGGFQKSLDGINAGLMRMAGIVEANLAAALKGLLERDSHVCADVIADDEEVDNLEKEIDGDGLRIITLYQPVASDLRSVVTAMKVSTNLERVGDQAVGIAKRARKINKNPEVPETRLIEPLFQLAIMALRASLQAYRSGDVESAVEVKAQDEIINREYKEISKKITARMEEDSERVRDYLNLQFIARFLERIGDHAKNICEDAVFAEAAVDIRHGGSIEG